MCSREQSGLEVLARGECRICQEEDQTAHLLSPCRCSGSIKYIHLHCLVGCIESKDSVRCDICGANFVGIAILTRKRTLLEFVQLNPALRNELLFAAVLLLLLQVSLLCQLFSLADRTNLWFGVCFQFGFALFYSTYLYYLYSVWAPDHLKVTVLKPTQE